MMIAAVLPLALGCGHVPLAAGPEPVRGKIEVSDVVFLTGDPAATRHCAVDADCPRGSLCHPGNLVCFTTSPLPPVLAVSSGAQSKDHGPCPLMRVYFPFDSASLVEEAKRSLAYDARCLKSRGARHVVLTGFADARGGHDYNVALSRRRGEVARETLRAAGLEVPIDVVGKGDASPLKKGDDELSFAFNRRVEIRP
jgi:hypothetical protein